MQDNYVFSIPISTSTLTRIGEVLGLVRRGGLAAILVVQRFARQIQLFSVPPKT